MILFTRFEAFEVDFIIIIIWQCSTKQLSGFKFLSVYNIAK